MQRAVSKVAGLTTATVMADEALGALYDLRWMVALAVFLILADFWLGVNVSSIKGVEMRFSRAWRRTFAKFWEYLLYLLGGALLGLGLFEPLGFAGHTTTAAVCLLLGCSFELQSIIGHLYWLRTGRDVKFRVWTFGLSLLKKRHGDIGEAIDEATKEE